MLNTLPIQQITSSNEFGSDFYAEFLSIVETSVVSKVHLCKKSYTVILKPWL